MSYTREQMKRYRGLVCPELLSFFRNYYELLILSLFTHARFRVHEVSVNNFQHCTISRDTHDFRTHLSPVALIHNLSSAFNVL